MQPIRASIVGVIATAGLALPAHAAIYTYNWSQSAPVPGVAANNSAGYIDSIDARFDTDTRRLSFTAAFGPATGQTWLGTKGFWMVMSGGASPRDVGNTYGIFYFDGSSLASPKLTVYSYNGSGTENSYVAGELIRGAWDPGYVHSISAVDKTIASGYRRVMSFDIDASSITGFTPKSGGSGWVGTGFGPQIGLWFYPVLGFSATYTAQGGIGTIAYFQPGWLNISNLNTGTETSGTPTPGAAAVLGLGAVMASRRRRR